MKLAGLKSQENAHNDSIWAAAWVPATEDRPSLLLTGSLDETVRLWRPDELVAVGTPIAGHCLGVVSVAAHPSGLIAASASLDSFVRVFEIDSNVTMATLEAPPSEVWNMQFDPSLRSDIIVTLSGQDPRLLYAQTRSDAVVSSARISAEIAVSSFWIRFEGAILAVAGGGSGSIKLWDTSSWQLIDTLAVPPPEGSRPSDKSASGKFVLSVAWSPDGKYLACGSMDGTIAVFDVSRAKFLHHLDGHFMPVRSIVYSPADPRVLFTACDDSHIHMYDAEGKSMIAAMSGHTSWVLSVDASPDGAAIATGSSDKTVRLWDIGMRSSVQTMTNHTDQVWGVAFRPPGGTTVRAGRLASVSDDKSISLYDYS